MISGSWLDLEAAGMDGRKRLKSLLSIVFLFLVAGDRVFAEAETQGGLSIFLNERVSMVAEESSVPSEALPRISLRAEMDGGGLFLVFDCDARNLNLPEGEAPPYQLQVVMGRRGMEKGSVTLNVDGDRSAEPLDLKVKVAVADGFDESGWKKVTATQAMRQDGIWRVTFVIPVGLLAETGMVEKGMRMQAMWRQLTGVDEAGAPTYLPSGGLIMAMPGKWADLLLRSPTPGDVAPMLTMLARAPDVRCADRCLRRLLWIGRRDESIRGALVMAMEHADPLVRAAAARVWTEWSCPEMTDLPELKAKAKAILDKPGP